MILCIDVGNSNIFGGIFNDENELLLRFRHRTQTHESSDDLGTFLRKVLAENNLIAEKIDKISICSVVPELDYSLRNACIKYFSVDPFFLKAGTKTGLHIRYRNPLEVGADRIATAIAAEHEFPNQNIIVIDLGTATTFCAISAKKEYLGGVIAAGLKTSMFALQSNTAKLSSVEIIKPKMVSGRSTIEGIQAGLYYGHLGMLKEITRLLIEENFAKQPVKIIGTGGFSHLFANENVFNISRPDLVLFGLKFAWQMNHMES